MKCPCCGAELALHAVEPRPPQGRRPDGPRGPDDMTPERAAAFVVPFGKHRGLTLAELALRDPEYFRWGASQWDRALGRAAKIHLAQLDAAAGRASRP